VIGLDPDVIGLDSDVMGLDQLDAVGRPGGVRVGRLSVDASSVIGVVRASGTRRVVCACLTVGRARAGLFGNDAGNRVSE
jgi:hypothetical protein